MYASCAHWVPYQSLLILDKERQENKCVLTGSDRLVPAEDTDGWLV